MANRVVTSYQQGFAQSITNVETGTSSQLNYATMEQRRNPDSNEVVSCFVL